MTEERVPVTGGLGRDGRLELPVAVGRWVEQGSHEADFFAAICLLDSRSHTIGRARFRSLRNRNLVQAEESDSGRLRVLLDVKVNCRDLDWKPSIWATVEGDSYDLVLGLEGLLEVESQDESSWTGFLTQPE